MMNTEIETIYRWLDYKDIEDSVRKRKEEIADAKSKRQQR